MRHHGTRAALFVASLCLLTSFEGPAESEVGLGLARAQDLCEAEQFEQALLECEGLLRTSWLDVWRLELEREGSWVVGPLLDLADPWLERLDLGGTSANERAAIHYTEGLILHRESLEAAAPPPSPGEEEPVPAPEPRDAFERAIALAVEPGLRADASYNVATLAVLRGEEWRAQLPEVSGQAAAPPASAPGTAQAGAAPETDPLEEARAAYLEAKELLIIRLRLDWRDADTRANLELVLRRLKELDEIEKQREEEEQQQDQQQDQQDQQQDQDKQDQQDQQQDSQDQQDQQPDQQEQQDPQEQRPPEQPEEPQPGEEDQEPSPESQQQPEEQYLTREEVQRLLDKLKAHEEELEALKAQLRQSQRSRTARDW
jgi:chemotaxis protein histidine kinase CheA